jgi:hypothetical protein
MMLALTCASDLVTATGGRFRPHDTRRARTRRLRPHLRTRHR